MSRSKQKSKKSTTSTAETLHGVTLSQLEKQVQRHPGNPAVWKGLATWHLVKNDFEQAKPAVYKAYELAPDDPGVIAMYAAVLYNEGKIIQALDRLSKGFHQYPHNKQLCHDLALMQHRSGLFEDCLTTATTGLSYQPTDAKLLQLKAGALKSLHRLEDAYDIFCKLCTKDPSNFSYLIDKGNIERDKGLLDQAIATYELAKSHAGENSAAYSNLLTTLHYHPNKSLAEILEVCHDWQQTYALDPIDNQHSHLEKNPNKTLRIGLLSDGLKKHPVGNMITSVIEALPKQQLELVAFSSNDSADAITERLMNCCVGWHLITQLSDEKLFNLIQQEKIDILIELSGHNSGSRMRALSLKPAPIIIKWVGGLINTTGVKAIDYLLSDWIETPEGVDEYYTEALIRMPHDYICYDPPAYAPEVSTLPALTNGYITFGCFNNPTKINDQLLEQWSMIMHQVPGSRLLLKSFQFSSPELCRRITDTLSTLGISSDRVILEGPSPHEELLATYNRVDIALDTWPYSGGLTTCEALLMGVPVVTHPGPTFAGRHSATHLVNAGLPELVTDSWEVYQKRVLDLASDLNSLATIRSHLRAILLHSPVCDASTFAKYFAVALKAVWVRYCEGKTPIAIQFNDIKSDGDQQTEHCQQTNENYLDTAHLSRPTITLPEAEKKHVEMIYKKARTILEYGSGGSTVLAAEMHNKVIFSVENDLSWAKNLRTYIASCNHTSTVILHEVDVGETGPWARPIDDSNWRSFHKYPLTVWDREDFIEPDVVLIDGRFRVACFITTLMRITKPTIVLFDDYTDRPYYHIVEKLVAPSKIVGRMAEFLLLPNTDIDSKHLTWIIGSYNTVTYSDNLRR